MPQRSGLLGRVRNRFRKENVRYDRSKTLFSLAQCHRILKKAGSARVSDEAVEELRNAIEEIAFDIATQAFVLADKAARRTVKREDVRSAAQWQHYLEPFVSRRQDQSPSKKP